VQQLRYGAGTLVACRLSLDAIQAAGSGSCSRKFVSVPCKPLILSLALALAHGKEKDGYPAFVADERTSKYLLEGQSARSRKSSRRHLCPNNVIPHAMSRVEAEAWGVSIGPLRLGPGFASLDGVVLFLRPSFDIR
jgi:hypothetical protein